MNIRTVKKIPFNDDTLIVIRNDSQGNEITGETINVPKDELNTDYIKILEWIADGNTISEAG
jgi:hypothetical protein|tara:strand:+ start:416 stop:601 length:186 start_codon:yes stop_codon:yes gene_type:complete